MKEQESMRAHRKQLSEYSWLRPLSSLWYDKRASQESLLHGALPRQ